MQSDPGQDGEFGAGVEAFDVFGGVGLGEAELLGFAQSGGEGNAVGLDLAENVVAGAVENAADSEQFIASQSGMQSGNYGDAAGDGRAKLELLFHPARQVDQVRAATGDQLLVGGDHGLARGECAADPVFGGLKAAQDLDHDIGVGGQDVVDILCPQHRGGKPVHFFSRHVAIEDVGQAEVGVGALAEDSGHRTADGAESKQGHVAGVSGIGCAAASGSEFGGSGHRSIITEAEYNHSCLTQCRVMEIRE